MESGTPFCVEAVQRNLFPFFPSLSYKKFPHIGSAPSRDRFISISADQWIVEQVSDSRVFIGFLQDRPILFIVLQRECWG